MKGKKTTTANSPLKAQDNPVDTCCRKPPPSNSVLEKLHSPTHVPSEGLLQCSIGNYTSTASSKSSSLGQDSPRLLNLADLVSKSQTLL